MSDLALKYGLDFADLYERDGLVRLDRAFLGFLAAADAGLHDRLLAGRADPDSLGRKAESDLLVELAPHLEDFVGELFGIGAELRALQAQQQRLAPLYSVKRLFVQRRAVKEIREDEAAGLDDEAAHAAPLAAASRYAAWATLAPAGREQHRRGLLFKVPHRLDMNRLVPVETVERDGVTILRLDRNS